MADVRLIAEDETLAIVVHFVTRTRMETLARERGDDWVVGNLDALLRWLGTHSVDAVAGLTYVPEKQAKKDLGKQVSFDGIEIKTRGFGPGGRPLGAGTAHWRRVLLSQWVGCDAILVAADTDRRRMEGLHQAVSMFSDWSGVVLVATPHPEAEAWILSGMDKHDEAGSRRSEVAAAIGFDPVRDASRLTSTDNTSDRDTKRVLRRLLGLKVTSSALPGHRVVELCEQALSHERQEDVDASRLTEFRRDLGALYSLLGAE